MTGCITAASDMVCALTKVTLQELKSFASDKEIALARKMLCWVTHRHMQVSLPQLGQWLGGRDHSTILFLIRDLETLAGRERRVQKLMTTYRKEVLAWHWHARRDRACQTAPYCATLRLAQPRLAPRIEKRKGVFAEVAWHDRDGETMTPVDDFAAQNARFVQAMLEAGYEPVPLRKRA